MRTHEKTCDSWKGLGLMGLAVGDQDIGGETVVCSVHDIKVKVASFYVQDVVERRLGFLLELGFISAEFR